MYGEVRKPHGRVRVRVRVRVRYKAKWGNVPWDIWE